MSAPLPSSASQASASAAVPEIDLKNPHLAALLAWLLPGLGHWYQGRKGKAVLFLVCILGTFCWGLYLSDGRAVYLSFRPEDWRLPYICQIGVGVPAMPAMVQTYFAKQNKAPPFGSFMARPERVNGPTDFQSPPDDLDAIYERMPRRFELGTVYTMIAGLLNILAIYDAWAGPAFSENSTAKKKDDDPKPDRPKS